MASSATHSDLASPAGQLAKPQVLAIGPWHEREFAAALTDILAGKDWLAGRDWPTVTNIDSACDALTHSEQLPELIFLAQPLPGYYLQTDIDRLQQLVPLTRLVIVAGTWCEGELRTGTPPTGAIRLYWYELSSWWLAALRQLDASLYPLWSLPLDHAQAGRCSTETHKQAPTKLETTILIAAADFAVYETLAAALRSHGITCYHEKAAALPDTPTAGIWDGGQLSESELQRLTSFCRQVSGPVVALLDFPRIEHIQQAESAGAAAVMAKPYIVEELVGALMGAKMGLGRIALS